MNLSAETRGSAHFCVYSRIRFWFSFLGLTAVLLILAPLCTRAQIVTGLYGNNPAKPSWRQIKTPHFLIIYPQHYQAGAKRIAVKAERIYSEFRHRLGKAPPKPILLYYNGDDEIVSGKHALGINQQFRIWEGDPLNSFLQGRSRLEDRLRNEIAYNFDKYVHSSLIKYFHYLKYPPADPAWPHGLRFYLAVPGHTAEEEGFMRWYWQTKGQRYEDKPTLKEWINSRLGRSQIQYFNNVYGTDLLRSIYTTTQSLLGLFHLFDFKPAFHRVTGLSYHQFEMQWKAHQRKRYKGQRNRADNAEEKDATLILSAAAMRAYNGGAIEGKTGRIAFAGLPNGGSLAEKLYVSQDGRKKKQIIAHGRLQPVMDWSPDGRSLVFAKRDYDGKTGVSHYHLYRWQTGSRHSRPFIDRDNARLPAFSPGGDWLAFAVEKQDETLILQYSIATGAIKRLYSFGKATDITQIDYGPGGDRLLISYRRGDDYRAGLLRIGAENFRSFPLQSSLPVAAQWSSDGSSIYFNDVKNGVANIFKARLSGDGLHHFQQVTDRFSGAALWDVATDSSGAEQILARSGTAYATGQIIRYAPEAGHPIAAPEWTGARGTVGMAASADSVNLRDVSELQASPYHAFLHTRLKLPIGLPYYAGPDNVGFGAYVRFQEPMRTHALDISGIFSVNHPLHKSYFFTSYTNNSFRPRFELHYNRFSDGALILGRSRKVKTANVLAASSIWKLSSLSREHNNWYLGGRLRYLTFDYFSDQNLSRDQPDIIFNNQKTRQTDLKAALTWRNLASNRNAFIDPPNGAGVQLAVTGSDDILGSEVKFARFNLAGYKVFPAFSKHHIYLYANGIIDAGEPAGRDFLGFDNNGSFELPGPKFMGTLNPGIQRFVRGYHTNLLGDKLLFGRLEYRIPFQFNTTKKLFGFLPPARTVLAFFADGGVLGDARVSRHKINRRGRLSVGAEIKRVFAFAGFKVAYEFGLGQALTRSMLPHPYIRVRTAIPF